MLAFMEEKTKNFSFRVPIELSDRFDKIKNEQAHSRVPNSELLVEAVRLYVDLAERYGIDENLIVKQSRAAPRQKGKGSS